MTYEKWLIQPKPSLPSEKNWFKPLEIVVTPTSSSKTNEQLIGKEKLLLTRIQKLEENLVSAKQQLKAVQEKLKTTQIQNKTKSEAKIEQINYGTKTKLLLP